MPLSMLLSAAALGSAAVVVVAPAPPDAVLAEQRRQIDALGHRPWQRIDVPDSQFVADRLVSPARGVRTSSSSEVYSVLSVASR